MKRYQISLARIFVIVTVVSVLCFILRSLSISMRNDNLTMWKATRSKSGEHFNYRICVVGTADGSARIGYLARWQTQRQWNGLSFQLVKDAVVFDNQLVQPSSEVFTLFSVDDRGVVIRFELPSVVGHEYFDVNDIGMQSYDRWRALWDRLPEEFSSHAASTSRTKSDGNRAVRE